MVYFKSIDLFKDYSLVYNSLNNIFYLCKGKRDREKTIKKIKNETKNIKQKPFFMNKEEAIKIINNHCARLTLNPTENCNFRCKYCIYSDNFKHNKKIKNKSMTKALARRGIDFFYNHSKKTKAVDMVLYGGEPLFNYETTKFAIEYFNKKFKNKKKSVTLVTNGSLINDERLNFLIRNNVRIDISIDGSKELNKYRVYKNNQETYSFVKSNIDLIKKKYPGYFKRNVGFQVTMTPPYDFLKIMKFFKNNYPQQRVRYSPVTTYGSDLSLKLFKVRDTQPLYLKKLRRLVEYIKNSSSSYLKNNLKYLLPFFEGLRPLEDYRIKSKSKTFKFSFYCIPGNQIVVNYQGNVYPCAFAHYFLKIGDLEKGLNYNYIFQLKEKYEKIVEGLCVNCWHKIFCPTCYYMALDSKKNDITLQRRLDNCFLMKQLTEMNLRLAAILIIKLGSNYKKYLK